LHVIPAVELSTTHEGCEQHILGYFIDPLHPEILRYAENAVTKRRERIEGMIQKLQPFGIQISMADVIGSNTSVTRALGRPHLARALAQKGYVQTVAEAFDRFIGDQGPAYLPTDLLSPQQGFDLIHKTGGLAIWAHPRANAIDRNLATFIDWGLDGVECYRPNAPPAETMHLESVAATHNLLTTGGSDWHGSWQGKLGDFYVTTEEVEKLLERGGM
jgi:3',5'-nucleoside bisphosphate phosphatase